MTPSFSLSPPPIAGSRRAHFRRGRGRWFLLLALSLLLHVVLLAVVGGGMGQGTIPPPRAPVMQAVLQAPPAAPLPEPVPAPLLSPPVKQAETPAPAPPKPRPKPPRLQRPAAPAAVVPDATPAVAASTAVAETTASPAGDPSAQAADGAAEADRSAALAAAAEKAAAEAAVAAAAVPATPTAPAAPTTPATPAAPPRYKVDLPPSATLSYEVRYSTRGSITSGSSVIHWRANEAVYAIQGEITKFGFALSSFRSEGAIDDAGIAPAEYAEKNARRAETTTLFSRDARQAISFSASNRTYPLHAGAQDRGSILWQLSGIARANGDLLLPGARLDIVVAGVRNAERWTVEVVGEETISLERGEARAWHLVRVPLAGTSEKRLDIWLAPEREWYPVKLRYTENSGDYLDLSLSEMR